MITLRLKAIKYNCDFRRSDFTLYADFCKHKSFPGKLKPGEVYLFVSTMENQLIWFLNQHVSETDDGTLTFTDSRRWRFSGYARWNPDLLQEYAERSGIQLAGIRSFQKAFLQQRADKEAEAEAKVPKIEEIPAVIKKKKSKAA